MGCPPRWIEVQRFRQVWLVVIVLAIAGLMWWGFVSQIVLGRPWGSKPAPDVVVWALTAAFGVGLPLLFGLGSMRTIVDEESLRIRFFGVFRRVIPRLEITEATAVSYRPLLDYGGWGIRLGLRGWCYNVSGHRGVLLRLRDGREVLVGSQDPDRLVAALAMTRPGSGS